MSKKHLADKPLANGTVTTSLGTSSSSNITAGSSGYVGIGDHSLFPKVKPDKDWASKTDTTMDFNDDSLQR